MDRLDGRFRQRRVVRRQVDDIVKGILEADDIEMVAQGLFGDSNAFLQDKGRLTKRQRIALDGVGIVRRLDDKFIAQPLQLGFTQRTQVAQCIF